MRTKHLLAPLAALLLASGACEPKTEETTDGTGSLSSASSGEEEGPKDVIDRFTECAPERCVGLTDPSESVLCVLEWMRSGESSSFRFPYCTTDGFDEWESGVIVLDDGTVTTALHHVSETDEGFVHVDTLFRCQLDLAKVDALIQTCQEQECGWCFLDPASNAFASFCEDRDYFYCDA
ncbi:MAG: hypothetical protein R3A51_14145 [Nannocystaceae bacterium]